MSDLQGRKELPDHLNAEQLCSLADSGDVSERRAVAIHPNTSIATLTYLAEQRFSDDVYENPLLMLYIEEGSAEVTFILEYIGHFTKFEDRMVEMSQSVHYRARFGVCRNVSVPEYLLVTLSRDPHPIVRSAAAENKRLPLDSLLCLVKDPHPAVRGSLIRNKSTPIDVIENFVGDEAEGVRWVLANCERVSGSILARLSQDKDVEVRWAVAMNAHTPEACLRVLSHSSIPKIKTSALKTLEIRGK